MKFTTRSGTTYSLTDIQEEEHGGYSAVMTRGGVPLVHVRTGEDMDELTGERAYFAAMPEVGESFFYATASHAGCVSTPITEVTE